MPAPLFPCKPVSLILEEMRGENRLRRVLGPMALTSLGIGCVIGTGIFVLVGVAAHDKTGPALILSFVVAGLACIFAALCYAEFASTVPVAGSAYTYAYATLGELLAWIIGWDLILEYTVASATVAHGWSAYFQKFLQAPFHLPGLGVVHLQIPKLLSGAPFDYNPTLGRLVATGSYLDLPAIAIALIVTVILVKGIRESATVNTLMVVIKVAVVLMVIVVGAFYVDPRNWHPFAPYGLSGFTFFGHTVLGKTDAGGQPLGMLAGAAIIFFAYIGFDSVSTHAEEAKNPKRDVPIGIIASLLICTALYLAVAAVITGMVPYHDIDVNAPVASVFEQHKLIWAKYLISAAAIAGISSVLLVLMLSQPRVWLAMARDGLVPTGFFGAVHPRFRTPWKATILTGLVVALGGAFIPLRILADLVNIGTLLAFVIVCAAVLVIRRSHPDAPSSFRTPFVPAVPILGILLCILLMLSLPVENWLRLGIWLVVGLVIYLCYGRKHSVMARLNGGARPILTPLARRVVVTAVVGLVIGGVVGFLLRPSAAGVQLPFLDVITRGARLHGLRALLVPLAHESFNHVLAGVIIGSTFGTVIGFFIPSRRRGGPEGGEGSGGGEEAAATTSAADEPASAKASADKRR